MNTARVIYVCGLRWSTLSCQGPSRTKCSLHWGSLNTLHFHIVDANGNDLVLEFEHDTGVLLLRDNPLGILTNEPQLPEQLQLLALYMKETQNVTALADGTLMTNYVTLPGAFDPISRFQRLALLNSVVNVYPYSSTPKASYSPYFGITPGKPELITVMLMLQKVTLPLSINYNSQLETSPSIGSQDRTQWTVLRDHTDKVLYFNSPTSPQYQALDIKVLARRYKKGVRILKVHNGAEQWFKDSTLKMIAKKPSSA
ncbi:hypothetical protein CEUSTIGMA_g10652.t1 [Chlamydomonas eustigma]|uniref:Choloylglycine hydrolase/NAAA C-terminal domain-containing protein n=1 Tax=Chlamydomonas eustigma TaxID=1157962 RepID=A0A250XJM9_9CHLO|nr:hypothetical protein CEUSTIGMA_g10652.t1 [Chlamydomonas eustigma]|eukprot:GAX83226.1 hypothetical protein CEUSTIGMA_g10652.t1 [Chlamydomonas eustigma]